MSILFSICIMTATIYSVRMLPLMLFRKDIQSPWIRSFLYYVPYVTLAVMTFPAIVEATDHLASGFIALAVGLITAWISGDLFLVAICCCASVVVSGLFI